MPVAFVLPPVRRVLTAGYGRAEIIHVLTADIEQQDARTRYEFGHEPAGARNARFATYVGLGFMGFGAVLGIAGRAPEVGIVSVFAGAALALFAAILGSVRYHHGRDVAGTPWLRFWKSPLGRWTLRLAGLDLERPGTAEAAAAADVRRWYDRLTPESRDALPELPALIQWLESLAQRARAWFQSLGGSPARNGAEQTLADTVGDGPDLDRAARAPARRCAHRKRHGRACGRQAVRRGGGPEDGPGARRSRLGAGLVGEAGRAAGARRFTRQSAEPPLQRRTDYGRYLAGIGLFARSASQKIVTTHHRVPSLKS